MSSYTYNITFLIPCSHKKEKKTKKMKLLLSGKMYWRCDRDYRLVKGSKLLTSLNYLECKYFFVLFFGSFALYNK